MRDQRVVINLALLCEDSDRTVVHTASPWSDQADPGGDIGLLIIREGADRLAVAATWFPHLTDGAFVVLEDPVADKQKLAVMEQRMGKQSLEGGYGVFRI